MSNQRISIRRLFIEFLRLGIHDAIHQWGRWGNEDSPFADTALAMAGPAMLVRTKIPIWILSAGKAAIGSLLLP